MNKRILGVSLLHATIIAVLFIVYFQLSVAEIRVRVWGNPIVVPPPWYFNPLLFFGTSTLLQTGVFYFLAKKFLTTVKEVAIVSILVFTLLGLYPILTTVPAIFKYFECRGEIAREYKATNHEAVGECFTFMENAKAYVVIPMLFVFLATLSGINIYFGVQSLKRH